MQLRNTEIVEQGTKELRGGQSVAVFGKDFSGGTAPTENWESTGCICGAASTLVCMCEWVLRGCECCSCSPFPYYPGSPRHGAQSVLLGPVEARQGLTHK